MTQRNDFREYTVATCTHLTRMPKTPSCRQLKGYECTRIQIDILLSRLKGLRRYKAGVALKRWRKFPLFTTMKVCWRVKQGAKSVRGKSWVETENE